MDQELANPNSKKQLRTNTQTYKIQEIWKKMAKSDYEKESDEYKKMVLKGKLYTKLSQICEEEFGKKVKRSTIRRCVNSLTDKAK
jgi:hypothetical protein